MNALLPVPGPAEPSPVKTALDSSWTTLAARLRNLRRTAITAAGLGIAILLSALIGWSFWYLWGLAVLPLIGFAYVRRERRMVDGWENQLLDMWATGGLYLGVVVKTLALHPTPLKSTLDGMLDLLPKEEETRKAAPAFIGQRRVLAATRQSLETRRWIRGCGCYLSACALGLGLALSQAVSIRLGALTALGLWIPIAAAWTIALGLERKQWRNRLRRIRGETPWEKPELEAAIRQGAWATLPRAFRRILAEVS